LLSTPLIQRATNNPPDLSCCVFVIEQALSVRALQELVTAAGTEQVKRTFNLTFSIVIFVFGFPSNQSRAVLHFIRQSQRHPNSV
ncbi:unnamed protein product, partial [Allacma fusca]